MSWRDDAACRRLPWEYKAWFWGEGDKSVPVHEQHERARMICYLCPSQMDCLLYWFDTDENFGVWGGLTVSQRKRYLMPLIRKKGTKDHYEIFTEVLWTLGNRLLPKLQQLFLSCGEEFPDLPVTEPLPNRTLVQILDASSREDQALIAS